MLKKLNAMPVLKYSHIAGAAVLWLVRLSNQLGDFMQSIKYFTISLLLVAVATIQARLREVNMCGARDMFHARRGARN